jgi:glycosyltransferase involved in cell wall biosynthesis
MNRVKHACKANALGDLVTFTGRVPHEEVEAYYSLVDVAPFPRLPQPVTELVSPLKPFEAMAMEKAVIASDVHALTEIVQHEHTGLLFEKGNASSLADALLRFIDGGGLRAECGRTARTWVEKERDWSSISQTLDETYRTLLEVP